MRESHTTEYPDRRSVRIREYDYSQPGAYFVTVCVRDRTPVFGQIEGDKIILTPAERIVEDTWIGLPQLFPAIEIDRFCVMPDHFHGIVFIHDGCRGDPCDRPTMVAKTGEHKVRPYGTKANSLGRIIQVFKSLTTHEYVKGVKELGWPPFNGQLWQRNYYEHVIRNEQDLHDIRLYIQNNPMKRDLGERQFA